MCIKVIKAQYYRLYEIAVIQIHISIITTVNKLIKTII